MSDEEREQYEIAEDEVAAIAKGALQRDLFNLLREARAAAVDMGFNEAKSEVARTGIGTAGTETYTYNNKQHFKEEKQGRPLVWTAIERAERDLLRQLVPILKRSRENLERGTRVEGGQGWSVHQFVRVPSDVEVEDMDVDEANEALFGPEPETGEYEEIDEEALAEAEAVELDGRIVDARSSLEEVADPTIGLVARALMSLDVFPDVDTMIEAVPDFPKWPDGKKVVANQTLTREGALALFDFFTVGDEEE